jgi:hypothetical protein
MAEPKETYIGDGVHASFDGEYIILRVHREPSSNHFIYLDIGVYRFLVEYAESIGWGVKPEQQR